jgi:hypothetical protein
MATKTTSKTTRKAPSRAATYRTVTKLQRKAEQLLAEAERTGVRSREVKPLRVRVGTKLRSKHPWLAAEAWLLIGACNLVGAGVKHGSRGIARVTVRSATHAKTKANTRKWVRALEDGAQLSSAEATKVLGSRGWGKPRFACSCGSVHRSAESMNEHFLTAHADEPRAAGKAPSVGVKRHATARTTGKVIKLSTSTKRIGRHQAATMTSPRNVETLVAHYRSNITQIGKQAMAVDGPTRKIAQAFTEFGDQTPPRHLLDLRSQVAGLEQALVQGSEGLSAYASMLRRRKNIAPEVVNPHFARMQELLETVAKEAAAFVADFEVAYHLHIKAASGNLATPEPEFFSKTG